MYESGKQIKRMGTENLELMKENIRESYLYFRNNQKRYYDFVKFVFKTALNDVELQNLTTLNKPPIEFNILEGMISRLRSEFAKQEPSISVRAADGVMVNELTPEFLQTMEVLESHLREIFFDGANDALQYNIFSDLLAGGYSVAHVYTDYINEMSFEQKICVDRVFDPTLTGFDPMARLSHKGDGKYCFQIYPMTIDEFSEKFGEEKAKGFHFHKESNVEDFTWSYKNETKECVMVVEYFEKEVKKENVVKLSNGHNILERHYKDLEEEWIKQGFIEQMPQVVAKRRTEIESICRYRICENEILDYTTTNYKQLPLVFIDGNSIMMKDTENGPTYQMTRPWVYHAKGVQKLKNFSGQTVAAEIQNMVMHKFIVPLEAIPDDYRDAYKNVQQASTLVYNSFFDKNPQTPLAPPREIQRTPTPPIVEATFMGTDQVTQMILGNYDTILGTNSNQLSGKAIQQGALQSNGAANPYLMGYIRGLNRIAQIIVDLIPKYYVTPRSLPIMKANGMRSYQVVNSPNSPADKQEEANGAGTSISLTYDPNGLSVKVEAGVNSTIQKQVALEEITSLMQASEVFAAFINQKGLSTILDNMDIRGIDGLKVKAEQFMKEIDEQKEAAANQPPPESDAMIVSKAEIEKTQIISEQKKEQAQGDMAIQAAKLALEKQKVDILMAELMANIRDKEVKAQIEQEKVSAEQSRSAIDMAIELTKHQHEMSRDMPQEETVEIIE